MYLKLCGLQVVKLSCCETWYSKDKSCYNIVPNEHDCRSFYFLKMIKALLFLNGDIFLPKPYMIFHDTNFPHMLLTLCWVFVKSCWPLLRDLSCSQDQDHIHTTYICCFYTGSTQKYAIHFHQINNPCLKNVISL